MEVKKQNPAWLYESHPNFRRWQRARDLSIERGKFVQSIVNQNKRTENLSILDLGSGEGGTAKVFSEKNFVVSFDLSLVRLQRQLSDVIPAKSIPSKEGESSSEKSFIFNENKFFDVAIKMIKQNFVNGNALELPFKNQTFDLIIIQDVIEHLSDLKRFYLEAQRVLKNNGTIYLSTPNKFSILNTISDPHFGLPFVSLLNRNSIKKYFLKYFRKDDYNRKDIAQLLSLKDLMNFFKNEFNISLHNKFSIQELFDGNKGIVWSGFHLKLISICKSIKIDRFINKIANDNFGVVNKYFTPTFYIILTRNYS